MRRHYHAARASWRVRVVVLLLGAVGLWHPALGSPAAAAAPASAETPFTWKTIVAPGGRAKVVMGQTGPLSFNGLVFLEGCVPDNACNDWEQSTASYLGPGGRRYYTYRNVRNGECLSHTAGLLFTAPCVWADESQWWSIQVVAIPCPPSVICLPLIYQLFSPWDSPGEVATSENGILVLHPVVGPIGSPAQHLWIYHVPTLPW